MQRMRLFLGALGIFVFACDEGEACERITASDVSGGPPPSYSMAIPDGSAGFAVIGDTQRTSFQECLIGREVNDEETEAILADLRMQSPAFIVFLGDMVFQGSSPSHWGWFDDRMEDLRADGVPVLPVMGNHEYTGDNGDALENVRARFSRLEDRTWYADRYGSIGMIWLDSNLDDVDGWSEQRDWYRDTIQMLQDDSEVAAILVFAHHPPYTNSTLVEGERAVRDEFVPDFCDADKALAFFSGHAHGYEHFTATEQCDKHFIISAGGGGPRPDDLREGNDAEAIDTYDESTPRPFNYLMVMPELDRLHVQARGIDDADSAIRVLESFEIPFAER